MKKTLLIIVLLVVFALLFAAAWWFLMQDDAAPIDDTTPGEERSFNPFGFFNDDEPSSDGTTPGGFDTGTSPDGVAARSALTQITAAPVAGATAVSVTIGTSTKEKVRYVEKETGHIFDYDIETVQKERLSNTTVPRVQEAVFGNHGNSIALRMIGDDGETTETYFGSIAAVSSSTPNDMRFSGSFLPQRILSLSVNPSAHEIFYLLRSDTGGEGYILSATKTASALSHPFYQWQVSWDAGSDILLTTAPSQGIGGIAYLLDPESGALARALQQTTYGLTALPNPHNDLILVGSINQGGMQTFVHDPAIPQTTSLSVGTLPEKCAWGGETLLYCAVPSNISPNLPDDWYQGAVSFSDTLWQIDTKTRLTTYLLDPAGMIPGGMDMTSPAVTEDGSHLSFINKKDGSLWLVDLSLALSQAAGTAGAPASGF